MIYMKICGISSQEVVLKFCCSNLLKAESMKVGFHLQQNGMEQEQEQKKYLYLTGLNGIVVKICPMWPSRK